MRLSRDSFPFGPRQTGSDSFALIRLSIQSLSGKLFHPGQDLTPTAVAPEEGVSSNIRTDPDLAVAISP